MRVTGGCARGQVISGPAGGQTRPTASKIRQAFFNIMRNKVPDARFLDLFAGTGLIGIEALSRGAACLTAVECRGRLARAIELDLKRLGFGGLVICADVIKTIPALEPGGFDIIYADPPYKSSLAHVVLRAVSKHGLLSEDGCLAIEHAKADSLTESAGNLILFDCRDYGQTAISFYRWSR